MTEYAARRDFRFLSRQVLQNPSLLELHEKRIHKALAFTESEPLQGAVADLFFGCWYDVPCHSSRILRKVHKHLSKNALNSFTKIVTEDDYLACINTLSTSWSVLTTPSLDAPSYRLNTSADYSGLTAKNVVDKLMDAKQQTDYKKIIDIENEFFAHCLACEDSMAFLQVWFKLNRMGWKFDTRWDTHIKLLKHDS